MDFTNSNIVIKLGHKNLEVVNNFTQITCDDDVNVQVTPGLH